MTAVVRVLGLALALIGASADSSAGEVEFGQARAVVVRSDGVSVWLDLELARTREQLGHGLMFRESLAPFSGMLFDFVISRQAAMWMKNTLIPLDMLFVTAAGKVVGVRSMTEPHSLETIAAPAPVRYVIELAGGEAERLGLDRGARVYLSEIRAARRF